MADSVMGGYMHRAAWPHPNGHQYLGQHQLPTLWWVSSKEKFLVQPSRDLGLLSSGIGILLHISPSPGGWGDVMRYSLAPTNTGRPTNVTHIS